MIQYVNECKSKDRVPFQLVGYINERRIVIVEAQLSMDP